MEVIAAIFRVRTVCPTIHYLVKCSGCAPFAPPSTILTQCEDGVEHHASATEAVPPQRLQFLLVLVDAANQAHTNQSNTLCIIKAIVAILTH
jgi:hypothetical protein